MFEKINRKTISSITRKILEYEFKSCSKSISRIRNVSLSFKTFENEIRKLKKRRT